MASFKKQCGVDSNQAENGKWADFGEIKVKVAFANDENRHYQSCLEKATQEVRRKMQANKGIVIDEAALVPEMKAALYETYAMCVVKDWKNVEDDDGKPLPFSKKACIEVIETHPAFWRWLNDYCTDLNNFQPEVAGDQKNSKTA